MSLSSLSGVAGAAPYIVSYDPRMFFAILAMAAVGLALYVTRDKGEE